MRKLKLLTFFKRRKHRCGKECNIVKVKILSNGDHVLTNKCGRTETIRR